MLKRPLLLVALMSFFAAPTQAQPEHELQKLAWLAGCWAPDGAEPGSVEHWLPLAGDTLLGLSRTVKRGRTTGHEFMQIRRNAAGRIEFIATVGEQKPVAFALVSLSETEAQFENPAHDFPQRVVYALEQGVLKARIEGQTQGRSKRIDFAMRRIRCEATPG